MKVFRPDLKEKRYDNTLITHGSLFSGIGVSRMEELISKKFIMIRKLKDMGIELKWILIEKN